MTDKPDSPHLSIPKMKARFLIAIAANDDAKQPDAKDKLKDGVRAGVADGERGGVRGDEARVVPAGLARVRRDGGGEGVE